ncbi:MAG: AAA family ATPase [Planctomycetes bacterium]|nr:AAA family ATPase [Planctomycetota bacterium]
MRVIMTGQIGTDKKRYVEAVASLGGERGNPIDVYHVGDRMYAEAPDVKPGRILDLPLTRLHSLRRAAFKDIINGSADQENVIVNTHATFRWRHGLFRAFDFDQIKAFKPDVFICLVDNIEAVYHRLHDDHVIDATLKDLMVWREEEIMATELVAQAMGCGNHFYVLSRGREKPTIETALRLVTRPDMRRVYPSFPMSHVMDMPAVLQEIDAFRAELAKHFIAFDPGDVDEKVLLDNALAAVKQSAEFIPARILGTNDKPQQINVSVKQVLDIAGDVDGQIYARDFKLIDQSDMIVSLVPELANGVPGLSSGVERELQHAFEGSKEVYVVWKPKKNPSPFITETSTKWFRSTEEALAYFEQQGMFAEKNLFGH